MAEFRLIVAITATVTGVATDAYPLLFSLQKEAIVKRASGGFPRRFEIELSMGAAVLVTTWCCL